MGAFFVSRETRLMVFLALCGADVSRETGNKKPEHCSGFLWSLDLASKFRDIGNSTK